MYRGCRDDLHHYAIIHGNIRVEFTSYPDVAFHDLIQPGLDHLFVMRCSPWQKDRFETIRFDEMMGFILRYIKIGENEPHHRAWKIITRCPDLAFDLKHVSRDPSSTNLLTSHYETRYERFQRLLKSFSKSLRTELGSTTSTLSLPAVPEKALFQLWRDSELSQLIPLLFSIDTGDLPKKD